jgi:sortase (surface protein transpeptidase)
MFDQEEIKQDTTASIGKASDPSSRLRSFRSIDGIKPRASATYIRRAATPTLRMEPNYTPPFVRPARPKQTYSLVLQRQAVHIPEVNVAAIPDFKPHRTSKLQIALVSLACFIFAFGLAVTIQAFQTNRNVAAQVSALSKSSKQSGNISSQSATPVPSTNKPSAADFNNYKVAPDLARYIKIPKLGVNARVLQVGVMSNGALGTPSNVYDAAWYSGSAKPGQPGATLIDGHVSSWTTHGVFYSIKTLVTGDTIQIVRGDGTVLNYRVVKTQTYNADNVNMQAAVTPITNGRSGLNLITCTGSVRRGTSEFTERVIIFAEQI